VLADDLTDTAVLEGLRRGTNWLAESSSVDLDFRVTARSGSARTAGIGERLSVPADTPVDVSITVRGVPDATVRFITDEGQMHQESLPAAGSGTVTWRTTPSLAAYVRAEIRHPLADGTPGSGNTIETTLPFGPMAAMTNPIFLGSGR
jgi:hypothetical protein